MLGGLGFSKHDWSRQTEEFSGGWQMRIALAKLLLQKPSLLLLDEPTNHLDLETRNWLEEYLHNYPNGYILISHDRYFLDVTVDKTIEIWNKALHVYHGNYEKYLTQKEERRAQLAAAYKNQREHIEHLEAFISRFRYQATKAKQVQSRIKELDKIERIEIPSRGAGDPLQLSPAAAFRPHRGRSLRPGEELRAEAGAGRRQLHHRPRRPHRAGGRERRGKIDPDPHAFGHGTAHQRHRFAWATMSPPNTSPRISTRCWTAMPACWTTSATPRRAYPTTDLRSLLGCFLFSGDDVFKTLGVLSGGERNRYALARILVSPANFLLLDEPTNHLDLRAKDVLLEAINAFNGTVVMVSHDRYFIDRLATRIFEVGATKVNVYPGNYEDYL